MKTLHTFEGFQGIGFFGKEPLPLQVTYAYPRGTLRVRDEKEEFFGKIPVRTELTILGPDLPNGQFWVREEREEI